MLWVYPGVAPLQLVLELRNAPGNGRRIKIKNKTKFHSPCDFRGCRCRDYKLPETRTFTSPKCHPARMPLKSGTFRRGD